MVVSNMDQIATKYGVRQQQYSDITQLCISISRINTPQLHNLEDCLLTLFNSSSYNGLSLNPGEKNVAAVIGTYKSAKIPFKCLHHKCLWYFSNIV